MYELMTMLREKKDYPRMMVGSRCSGRTTALASDAVNVAIRNPESSILMVAPFHSTVLLLKQHVGAFLTGLGILTSRGSLGVTLPNNSRIAFLTEQQVPMNTRGYEFTDLYIDNMDYLKEPKRALELCQICMNNQPTPLHITATIEG